MGITGLTKFIDNNNHLLKDTKLRDTKIIVDGNNLLHFLYYYYQVPHAYGGDYSVFADSCRSLLNSFVKCNILPYVVFDGAYHPRGQKFSSSLSRAGRRAVAADDVANGRSNQVLPLLAPDVFKEVLDEFKMYYVVCNFEADYHVASLAALWKCPVLTNDSDFFIFDLPGGVVLLDYLNVAINDDDASYYLNVQIFCSGNLTKWVGISNPLMLPLFATVMGNDVIDGDMFMPFCKKLDFFSKVPGMKLKNNARRKILGLLKWLGMKKNYSSAVADILASFPTDKQANTKELIEKSVASYTVDKTFLEGYFEKVQDSDDPEFNSFVEVVRKPVPKWFYSAVQKGAMSQGIYNAFVSQRCIMLTQIESFKEQSSHLCSLPIRQLAYGILIKTEKMQREEKEVSVKEYDREGKRLIKKVIKVGMELGDGSLLPSLEEGPSLEIEKKLAIILNVFKNDERWFLNHPQKDKLFLATVTFWVAHANPKVLECQILSLLVCFYAPEVCQRFIDEDSSIECLYHSIESTISSHLNRTKNRKNYFDLTNIHAFSQFQTCFQSISDLNKLLQCPFEMISVVKIFNSTCLAYVCHHLESNVDNPYDVLKEYLKENQTAFLKIKEIMIKLGNYGGEDNQKLKATKENESFIKGQKKKIKKTNKKSVEKIPDISKDSDPSPESPSALFNVDIENKFSKLIINDD